MPAGITTSSIAHVLDGERRRGSGGGMDQSTVLKEERTVLILSRKLHERVRLGRDVWVEIMEVKGTRVKLGIVAPPEMNVAREEILDGDEWFSRSDSTEAAS